jgi:hypothetical protein
METKTVYTLTYGLLTATTTSPTMFYILRKLGWKIKTSEFGELI